MKMETGGDFIGRKYHIKVIDKMQHGSTKKVKRFRSAFTTDQVNYLEKQFKKSSYIGNAQRKEVAAALNLQERAVKIWFQNRRMKEKKESTTEELDDKQETRKSPEYLINNNNNVSMRTVTEQPRSLPLIANLNQGHCDNNIETNTSTCNTKTQIVQDAESKDSATKIAAQHNAFTEQVTPEDLSLSRRIAAQQIVRENAPSNPGFLSLVPTVSPFYTQPYIPANGFIWKPQSVTPFVTYSSLPVPAPSNPLLNMSPVHDNFAIRPCNKCDCHVRQVISQIQNNFPQQSVSPQYIITAVPFQTPTTKK